jgi:hypothetical protein
MLGLATALVALLTLQAVVHTRHTRKGRHCGAPVLAELAQSIFHAEKITLGTAGSPAGFL